VRERERESERVREGGRERARGAARPGSRPPATNALRKLPDKGSAARTLCPGSKSF
jgi:hypothetical protein